MTQSKQFLKSFHIIEDEAGDIPVACILGEDNREISVYDLGVHEAETIVKACNSHYELVEALEAVQEYVHMFGESDLTDIVENALKKVKEC